MLYNLREMKENLRLTQCYCEMQMVNSTHGPESLFRSINPIYEGQQLFYFSSKSGMRLVQWLKDPYAKENATLITDIFNYQINFKKENYFRTDKVTDGKILGFLIDWTLFEGATIDESQGLLDDYDCPPIDTWFYMLPVSQGSMILAWIPAPFISFIEEAIDVNMATCIQWLELSHPNIHTDITT